jgi:hypothetical protein
LRGEVLIDNSPELVVLPLPVGDLRLLALQSFLLLLELEAEQLDFLALLLQFFYEVFFRLELRSF